jgi:hypothetical protein
VLEIALLAWREGVIDQDELGLLRARGAGDFLSFAGADEIARIRPRAAPCYGCDGLRTGRARQLFELLEILGLDSGAKPKAHEHGALSGARALEHASVRFVASVRRSLRRCALFDSQAHCARRHYGGDRMLVDHLADGVLEQYYELIEGIDLALQLNAVDQVNRHRYVFLA